MFVCASSRSGSGCSGDSGSALTSGSPAVLVGVMDTIEQVSNQYCQAGSTNGFVNTSAPEVRDFIEGSEAPPLAPRGGEGASIKGESQVGAVLRILIRWTVEWIVDAIDRKTVSPGVFGDTVLGTVASRLRPLDVEAIDEYASKRPSLCEPRVAEGHREDSNEAVRALTQTVPLQVTE